MARQELPRRAVNELFGNITKYTKSTYLTLTRNTTNTTQGNIYGSRCGNVVFIGGWFNPKSGIAHNAEIASGLPKPIHPVNVFLFDQNNNTAGAAYIESNTTKLIWGYDCSGMIGHIANISATYITGDNIP